MNIDKAIVEKTIDLAENFEKAYEDFNAKYYPYGIVDLFNEKFENTSDHKNMEVLELQLDNYLNSLDYENIKNLKSLMSLGLGNHYSNSASYEERFNKARESCDLLGWQKDKRVVVTQMRRKLPLGEYLSKGLKIIGM